MTTAMTEEVNDKVEHRDPPTKGAPVGLPTGQTGILLQTFEDYWKFASVAVNAGWARGMNIECAVVAMQKGAELGIGPVAALDGIAVINNRPAVWGDILLAICKKSRLFVHDKFKEWHTGTEDQDDWTAHCQVQRVGGPVEVYSFSLHDAKRQGGKPKHEHLLAKWIAGAIDVKRQLQMRARSRRLRDTFPDVTQGLYTAEEMLDGIVDALDLSGDVQPPRPAREIAAEAKDKIPPPPPEDEAKPESERAYDAVRDALGNRTGPAPPASPEPGPTQVDSKPADTGAAKPSAAMVKRVTAAYRNLDLTMESILIGEQQQGFKISQIAAWLEADVADLETRINELLAAQKKAPTGAQIPV